MNFADRLLLQAVIMPHTPNMKVLGLFVFTLLISCSLGGEWCFEQHECGDTEDGYHLRDDCTPDGCCQDYCQCFMGFAIPRDSFHMITKIF